MANEKPPREYRFGDTKVNIGGMMRCCTYHLAAAYQLDDQVMDGAQVNCHCGSRTILLAGIWRYDGDTNADT